MTEDDDVFLPHIQLQKQLYDQQQEQVVQQQTKTPWTRDQETYTYRAVNVVGEEGLEESVDINSLSRVPSVWNLILILLTFVLCQVVLVWLLVSGVEIRWREWTYIPTLHLLLANSTTPSVSGFPLPVLNRTDICNSSYWSALISTAIRTAPQFDHSVYFSDKSISVESHAGTARIMLVLLKLLCGHSISIGVVGTSVSVLGADSDSHFTHVLHHWLSALNPIMGSKAPIGLKNAAIAGTGSDFTALCFDMLFARSSWGQQAKMGTEVNLNESIVVTHLHDHSQLDIQYLTAGEAAVLLDAPTRLPDLLLVEFAANDFSFIMAFGADADWNLKEGDIPAATINMQHLLRKIWSYSWTAPLLLVTPISNWHEVSDGSDDYLSSIEPVYALAAREHAIPMLSVRRHLGLPIDRVSASGLSSLQRSVFDLPSGAEWKKRLLRDRAHLAEGGYLQVAIMIVTYLTQVVSHLISVIDHDTTVLDYQPGVDTISQSQGTFVASASDHVSTFASTTTGICSIYWGNGEFNPTLIDRAAVILADGFNYHHQNSGVIRNMLEKLAWTAVTDRARIVFDLEVLSTMLTGKQKGTHNSTATIVSTSIAALCSYDVNRGSALIWVSALNQNCTRINITEVRVVNSKWSLKQSTLVVQTLAWLDPWGMQPDKLSAHQLHIVNLENHTFSVAGINVEVASM